jgi:hypothetical protein
MQRTRLLFWLIASVILLLRLYYCAQLPTSSGDLLRHVQYAALVPEHGLEVFDQPLASVDPKLRRVPWSNVPFPYPATVMLFDSLVGYLLPSIFFAKLLLTIFELLGSWLDNSKRCRTSSCC